MSSKVLSKFCKVLQPFAKVRTGPAAIAGLLRFAEVPWASKTFAEVH